MLKFKEYIKLYEIAIDNWMDQGKVPLEGYLKSIKAPTSLGNINLDELPPTNKLSYVDSDILKIIKNRLLKKKQAAKNNTL